jgi:glycerol transport system permease protein
MDDRAFRKRTILLIVYLVFSMLPVYWMINMSFKTNEEIISTFSLWPRALTWDNYRTIFTDESWYSGYINSMIYVAINVVISLCVALPAAYAFSRYTFLGDKHVFFWLLTNRMTPPAVFLLPFFQLYTTLGLMDTHIAVALAHLLFNVPLAVWILEGFMSGIPREIDETAYIDGYSFPRFFLTIFIPLIKAGVGVAAFFCFMFSWVELLMARTLTSVNAKPIVAVMTRTASTPQSMPEADTVRVMIATMGFASTLVSVRAISSSTQLNMKQKNAATPMPALISGTKIFRKKRGNEYPSM